MSYIYVKINNEYERSTIVKYLESKGDSWSDAMKNKHYKDIAIKYIPGEEWSTSCFVFNISQIFDIKVLSFIEWKRYIEGDQPKIKEISYEYLTPFILKL